MALKNEYIVEKNNILNEIRSNHMTLQELRFFSIYLAKINARDISTRRVRFPLSDFQKIMEFGRLNIKQLQSSTNKLLCKVVNVPNERGGYTGFTIFKEVELFKDDNNSWVVEIDAHDKALPLLFDLKKNYFTYKLWNILRLKSANQLRMYELLKQHERQGVLEIKVSELRDYLYIPPNKHTRLERFRVHVLDTCQQALAEKTDLCYTYECGKRGAYGKWLTIVFHISKNKNYDNPLKLEEFIGEKPANKPDSRQPYLSGEFEKDITEEEKEFLCDMLACKVSKASERTPELLEKRLRVLYSQMLVSSKEPVKNAVKYLKSCIINIEPEKLPAIPKDDDFDVDMYKDCINNFDYIKACLDEDEEQQRKQKEEEEKEKLIRSEQERIAREKHFAEIIEYLNKKNK
ncbi:MAG: replication initiation protein [Ruminococcus flavefaciens]|nr:replication initiation protein [Ruminococcus flavefaciens]